MPKKIFLFILIMLHFSFAQEMAMTTVNYDSSGEIFPNPERGFSAYRSSPLTLSFCQNLRTQNVTVVQRIHTISQFRTDSISQSYLNSISQDFQIARETGVKMVMRFSYTNVETGQDAALDKIMLHLDQLQPLFAANYDVIAYVEAGFIGAWGEWYYSSNGLNNTTSRRSVLFKLLSVLPEKRMAVIRTPGYKKAIFNTTIPLSPDSAFSGSFRARTGAHNDCFLASADDYGTYGNIEIDKNYLNQDNRYVPQGGETCNPSNYSGCANALVDLKRMRWSVLNKDYHSTVLNGWVTNGCMDEIKRRLGYRFRLVKSVIQDSVKPGGTFIFRSDIVNDGFASPYNSRNLELLLRNIQTGEKYFLISPEDPRKWLPDDSIHIEIIAGIPQNMPFGDYKVLAHLADPEPALHNQSEYSIRLANQNTWEDSTGYNRMLHTLTINASAPGEDYTGELYFQPYNSHPSGIEKSSISIPSNLKLEGNFPNPFNSGTRINFKMMKAAFVTLEILSIDGQIINTLINDSIQAGEHSVYWNPDKLSSGIYFYRLKSEGQIQTGKAIYLK